jgi:hypothetical protein
MPEPESFDIPILGSVLYGVQRLIWAQTCTIVSSTPEHSANVGSLLLGIYVDWSAADRRRWFSTSRQTGE